MPTVFTGGGFSLGIQRIAHDEFINRLLNGWRVDALGAVAGGLSTAEASGMKTEAANSKPSAVEPVKPDSAGGSPHASATHDRGSPTPESNKEGGSHGGETARSSGSPVAIDTNVSAAEDASAH